MVALAQLAEHRIVAPKVTGSSPVGHPNSLHTPPGPGPPDGPRIPARSGVASDLQVAMRFISEALGAV
jgi:hypothetical protein